MKFACFVLNNMLWHVINEYVVFIQQPLVNGLQLEQTKSDHDS